jgi:hypothetical protein
MILRNIYTIKFIKSSNISLKLKPTPAWLKYILTESNLFLKSYVPIFFFQLDDQPFPLSQGFHKGYQVLILFQA